MSSTNTSPRTLKVPLVNVYAKGGYSAQLRIGAEKHPLNLILDTGSSTLVVSGSDYVEERDSALTPTSFAQEVLYGIGGWDGPVVYTRVGIREDAIDFDLHDDQVPHAHHPIVLEQCPVAVVSSLAQETSFADADGILGLAYDGLNKVYDLKDYFHHYGIAPALTHPWPFDEEIHLCSQHYHPILTDAILTEANRDFSMVQTSGDSSATQDTGAQWHQATETSFNSEDLRQFKRFLRTQPTNALPLYFSNLTSHGLTPNKFAFFARRSSIHVASQEVLTPNSANEFAFLGQDPLNQGWLILGGGEEHTELYQGAFKTIAVIENKYYNVNLVGMSIGDNEMVPSLLTQSIEEQEQGEQGLKEQASDTTQLDDSLSDTSALCPDGQHLHTHGVHICDTMRGQSNAIIDTGASAIVLTRHLFDALTQTLEAINPHFIEQIAPFKDIAFQQTGIDMADLQLELWPDLTFYFVGPRNEHDAAPTCDAPDCPPGCEPIAIRVTPKHYWQINTPTQGKACFKLLSQLPNWPDQSILGLPLMSAYYVVFDRSVDDKGVIRFAEQKPLNISEAQHAR
ncbi:pepsin-like aspartyl protease [Shewanella insulae]|uniref:pepsin-like aspartyl protease n=1 Tax=Shewanella insulae TaxID=2681496 RepID=UPI001EFD0D27|nr:pepsin-like aspartyl protease [Shewanella insulae]MCG9714578.1 pepsin-like aspartyl protease [Shewanella insulae]